ncbi:unnamed protein product [Lactuca virosa]|uniref:Uncharacterized protein n=1 Tax=Lactuca virosa TaxID=75947 RepID=A0AAU9N854_9ASTR|nr:unnamed protein product [Lactuca virosa]
MRVWIRVIYGVTSQLCIRFHPVNNNFLSVGNAQKEVSIFNFSTRRLISKTVVDSDVTTLDYDHTAYHAFGKTIEKITTDGEIIRLHHFKPIMPLGSGNTGRTWPPG